MILTYLLEFIDILINQSKLNQIDNEIENTSIENQKIIVKQNSAIIESDSNSSGSLMSLSVNQLKEVTYKREFNNLRNIWRNDIP